MPAPSRILATRTIYQGKVVKLTIDRVAEPGGVTTEREVVHHPGSVVVLPRLVDGRILLVRQYRHPARQYLWELVAGSIEPRERPLAAARRELLEETGYRAQSLRLLFSFYPSPGFLTERMYLVEARNLRPGRARPESDERIRSRAFTRADIERMLSAKRCQDGKTLVGLLWWLRDDDRSAR
jgi:ADP-ribose pyrophosphatase